MLSFLNQETVQNKTILITICFDMQQFI